MENDEELIGFARIKFHIKHGEPTLWSVDCCHQEWQGGLSGSLTEAATVPWFGISL
jgi:hypothetical protein